jgi:hypothetical protein
VELAQEGLRVALATAEQDEIARRMAEAVERALQGMTTARREAFVTLRYDGEHVDVFGADLHGLGVQHGDVPEDLARRRLHGHANVVSAPISCSQRCLAETCRKAPRAGNRGPGLLCDLLPPGVLPMGQGVPVAIEPSQL